LDESWLRLGASLGIGLLIGLERERNPAAKAGVRTFALVALAGTLAASVGIEWTIPAGLTAIAAALIAAYLREPAGEDPGTTTIAAAVVCYLLGVLAGLGETTLAGATAIAVTALLYFKPEIEGFSAALERHEQVSVLQFVVVTFVVLPILPDRGFGPYEALNPRTVWLMVVLVSGIGLATYVALRIARGRHGVVLTGVLAGLLSSTAATVLYARRSRESAAMERLALSVVPLANLVPLARIGLFAALLAPALLPALGAVLGAALAAGLGVTVFVAVFHLRRAAAGEVPPVPPSRNPAELGTALRFGALYALVVLVSAWLSGLLGDYGRYAVALTSGLVDVDPIALSTLNGFADGRVTARGALVAIGLAYLANVVFKLAVLTWFNRRLARHAFWPLAATLGAGAAALAATG